MSDGETGDPEPMNELPEDAKPPKYPTSIPPVIGATRPTPIPHRPKQRHWGKVLLWTLFACVLFVRFVWWREDHRTGFGHQVIWQQQERGFHRPPTPLYSPVAEIPNDLYRLHIEIAKRDVETLRGYSWNGWGGQAAERPQVQVTVREGNKVYTNVALHLKGAAGSFRRFDDKPALTLNFSKHAKGQEFHGYSKISLNNSVQDPTFLCEAISRELFEKAGVPAPRADFATVLINGRDLGLYVMVEGYNKDFLRRHFKNVKGNLYDGGFCQEVHPGLNINSGDYRDDRSEIDHLLAAATEPDASHRWARLTEILDTDRFVTMLAMEVLTCHWDGYGLNRNNYRLFHDRDAGRLVFMPHGMDQMFAWPGNRFSTDTSIYPRMNGLVAQAVLTTPEGSQLYRERIENLQTNLFDTEIVVKRVRELAQRIRPTLAAYQPHLAEYHDRAVDSLCERITRRIESVQSQLSGPRQSLEFDEMGVAYLTNWHRAFTGQGRSPRLDTVEEDGKTLLHIAARRGGSGSWRSGVLLPSGRYVFEGRARVSSGAVGSRVALRISGSRVAGQVVSEPGWIHLTFPFDNQELVSEVVLVCEFSGTRGEAWFDLESLRLVRERPAAPEQSNLF